MPEVGSWKQIYQNCRTRPAIRVLRHPQNPRRWSSLDRYCVGCAGLWRPIGTRSTHCGRSVVDQYPLVRKFLKTNPFCKEHAAHGLTLSYHIVPALEHFFSLEHVNGYHSKLFDILHKPLGSCRTNERTIQWASLCAEIGALYLLGKNLCLTIHGLEVASTRAERPRATCDISAAVKDGPTIYFEVKRKSAEDKQDLPDFLSRRLEELQAYINYGVIPELIDRNYNCENIEERIEDIKDHVRGFERMRHDFPQLKKPIPFECKEFRILFSAEIKKDIASSYFFQPISAEEISKHLFGPGGKSRNSRDMKPLVQQAIDKGADYLNVPRTRKELGGFGR